MMMKQPVHPGSIVKHDCLPALGLTVTEAAASLGVSRPTLSRVINEHAAVTPEMAIRLAMAFGSRPEIWLGMQLAYDLARAQRRSNGFKVKRFPHPPADVLDDVR